MLGKCIRFNLYSMNRGVKFQDLADEIRICFSVRANCEVHLEEYRRHFDNMFITVEVSGETEKIEQAIEEVQYNYNKYCEKSHNQKWFT